jgi:hypothetical protein
MKQEIYQRCYEWGETKIDEKTGESVPCSVTRRSNHYLGLVEAEPCTTIAVSLTLRDGKLVRADSGRAAFIRLPLRQVDVGHLHLAGAINSCEFLEEVGDSFPSARASLGELAQTCLKQRRLFSGKGQDLRYDLVW